MVAQVCGEDWRVQTSLRIVEEGLLLSWLDSVQAAEGQTHKPINRGVRRKARRYGLRELNSLVLHRQAADSDCIRVDVAGRRRSISVRDGPRGSRENLGSAAFACRVD